MRILYVEDEPERAEALELLLTRKLNHVVDFARGFTEAETDLHLCRYDLLILDIMLRDRVEDIDRETPDWMRRGIEILKRVRDGAYEEGGDGTGPNVPVLVVTAVVSEASRNEILHLLPRSGEGLDHAACWYLEKPVRLDEFEAAFAELVASSR